MDPDVLDIVDQPQLFVEDTMIAASVGLQRRIHQMTKVSPSPVLAKTEPYEGTFLSPITVIQDARTGQWRMWYNSYGTREVMLPGVRDGSLHLAISQDGVHWEKPALGVFAPESGIPNNICIPPGEQMSGGSCAVFDDPDDPDPTQRYKLIYYLPSYYLAYSADGITWRPAFDEPVWANGAGDGLEETFFFMFDELRNKYRGYMRVWQRHQTIRKTSLGESDDLITWDGPKIIWTAGPEFGIGAQIYGMNVFIDGGLYWALPWMFYTDQPLDPAIQQTMRFKLAWSKDGISWNPLAPEQDAVPMEAAGTFDCGMMLSSCPVVKLEDRIRLYYYGSDNLHNVGLGGQASVGLAEIRHQGFVSLHADEEGVMITPRFLFRGEEIHLNAKVEPGGCILAELLDDRGEIVHGFEYAHSDAFTGDSVDHILTWGGRSDISFLFGQNLMLRLKLKQADIFAFRAAGPRERFSELLGPRPVRCGWTTRTPVIDGILNDESWMDFTNSGIADNFVKFTEMSPASVKTKVWMTRDKDNLYIAVDCEEPLLDEVAAEQVEGEIDYQKDDMVEFRLSAPGQGTHFNQLMVTASGQMMHCWFSVEEGGVAVYEQIDWEAKTSSIPGHWYVEMAVPFKALGVEPPQSGEQWQMNIIRHRHVGDKEPSCWSCMYGSVHRNDRSGILFFV